MANFSPANEIFCWWMLSFQSPFEENEIWINCKDESPFSECESHDLRNSLTNGFFNLHLRRMKCYVYLTIREKLFYSIQYMNGCLAASNIFLMIIWFRSMHLIIIIKEHRCFKKVHCSFQRVLGQNLSSFLS